MRILMLKDYYYPEQCAGIDLALDLVEGFSLRKNEVTVYTPIPCRGISKTIREEYSKRKKETIGSTTVFRYWLPYEKPGIISRFFRYILQNVIQVLKGLSAEYDVLLLGSTPPTMGIVGTILKKIKKKPFVYNVQDIFPDSLVTGNITKEGSIIWKMGRLIEKTTYKNADRIIVINESFKRNLMAKGVEENKIVVVNNWIDTEKVYPVEKDNNRLYEEFKIPRDKFLVVYAGNFGAAQGANVVLEAAKKLENDVSIVFVIFGGGSEFDAAKKYVDVNGLKNVIINNLLPINRVSEVYSLGDLALITCKKMVGMAGMPSKTWSIMACNTPMIAAFDLNSELDNTIRLANAGLCIQPEDATTLANEILRFKNSNGNYDYKHGRDYVLANASKNSCVSKYADVLKTVVEANGGK